MTDVPPTNRVRWTRRPRLQRYARLVERIFDMGPQEIAQRVQLRFEGMAATTQRTNRRQTAAVDAAKDFIETLGADRGQRLGELLGSHFLFGPADRDKLVEHFKIRHPDHVAETLAAATEALDDRLTLLGQSTMTHDAAIDWQRDPQTQLAAWPATAIDEQFATGTEADVKYVWELNRHQFLPLLGRAFWFSGDERYAHRAAFWLESWIDQNPFGRGVNWSSHLEIAMRAISWLWTMPYLLRWKGLTPAFVDKWAASIAQHHYYLAHNLSVYTDPTNHLIGEAAALWLLSVCLPNLANADSTRERAEHLLIAELDRQVLTDGVNTEQATSYHRFVLDFYAQMIAVLERNGRSLPQAASTRVESMFDFAAALAGQTGNAPMIGDSDDARGVPFLELVQWNFSDLLSTGAVIFKRDEWKTRARTCAPATSWLFGPQATITFDSLGLGAMPNANALFPIGGYAFLGLSSNNGTAELIFDYGPIGLWPNAAHGHADALSILVRVNGRLILTDPGTGTYFGSAEIRDQLRQSAAHNTITVDDFGQADIFGTFKWINPYRVHDTRACVAGELAYVSATHDGFHRLQSPVSHRREILTIPAYGWLVIDRIEGRQRHKVTRHYNFEPGVSVRSIDADSLAASSQAANGGIEILFPQPACREEAMTHIGEGLWSDRYGHWQDAAHAEQVVTTELPTTLLTVIRPTDPLTANVHPSVFEGADIDRGGAILYTGRSAEFTELILINPAGRDVEHNELSSSSRIVFMRIDRNSDVQLAVAVGQGLTKRRNFELIVSDDPIVAKFPEGNSTT